MVSVIVVILVWFYQGRFQEVYVALLIPSFILVAKLIGGLDFESNNEIFWKKTVIRIVLQWFRVISLLLLIGFASKTTHYFSRVVLIYWFLTTPVVLVATHCFLRFLLNQLSFAEANVPTTVIAGINDVSRKLAYDFNTKPWLGVAFMGFFDGRFPERLLKDREGSVETLLGNIAEVAEFIKIHNVQKIYIALPMTAQPRILALSDSLRDTTASIYFVLDIFSFDLIQAQISYINDTFLMAVCESPFIGINGLIKRAFDALLSLFILLLLTPLMLLIAIGIKLSSPDPVLFKQCRSGLDGNEIIVYKFRNMTVIEDGEQVSQATRNDPIITWIGGLLRKTSLDELPQFINVLQGS
jgi:putative colanic acid biosynthesis UDP-glucose lipid carrier transferase